MLQSPGVFEFTEEAMQKLWFATRKRAWASLVVLPAAPGFSVLPLAEALARVGESCLGRGVHLLCAEGADFHTASRLVKETAEQVSRGNCVIVAVDCVLENAAGIPVLLAAEACLLGVPLGQSCFAQVNRTMEVVGASRFVGAVTFSWPGKKAVSPR